MIQKNKPVEVIVRPPVKHKPAEKTTKTYHPRKGWIERKVTNE